jgi:hypothetical protein
MMTRFSQPLEDTALDAIETSRPARARGRKPREILAEEFSELVEESREQYLTPAERERIVAEHAYYRAERRGFEPGSELEDWLEAEAELRSRHGWE